jgi:hypothetical protein
VEDQRTGAGGAGFRVSRGGAGFFTVAWCDQCGREQRSELGSMSRSGLWPVKISFFFSRSSPLGLGEFHGEQQLVIAADWSWRGAAMGFAAWVVRARALESTAVKICAWVRP